MEFELRLAEQCHRITVIELHLIRHDLCVARSCKHTPASRLK